MVGDGQVLVYPDEDLLLSRLLRVLVNRDVFHCQTDNVLMKKKYRSPTQRLILENDDLVRKIIRKRDKQCVTCGTTKNLQVGHLIKRGKKSVRWDLTNCNAQCASCNLRHNYYPEHYQIWYLERYGLYAYQFLVRKAGELISYSEMQRINLELREAL